MTPRMRSATGGDAVKPDEFGEFDDCGLMPDGQCMKAGSEECEWECGRRRLLCTPTGGGDA